MFSIILLIIQVFLVYFKCSGDVAAGWTAVLIPSFIWFIVKFIRFASGEDIFDFTESFFDTDSWGGDGWGDGGDSGGDD